MLGFKTHLVHCFKVIAQANLNNGVRYFCFPQGLGGFEGEFLGCKGHSVGDFFAPFKGRCK